MVGEIQVKEALKKVIDPDVGYNIVDLGLIYGIEIKAEGRRLKAKVKMTMTTPFCPYAPFLISQVKEQAGSLKGVEAVEVEVVWDPPWDKNMISEEAKLALGLG